VESCIRCAKECSRVYSYKDKNGGKKNRQSSQYPNKQISMINIVRKIEIIVIDCSLEGEYVL